MAGISAAGAIAALLLGGAPWLAGFLTGAAFSIVNFWFWHRLVRRVGAVPPAGERPAGGSALVFALRYGIFAAAAYAILRFSEASLSAALFGIFVAVAAVLFEILFELIYGT